MSSTGKPIGPSAPKLANRDAVLEREWSRSHARGFLIGIAVSIAIWAAVLVVVVNVLH